MATDEVIVLISPPKICITAGDDQQVSDTLVDAWVRLTGAEQAGIQGIEWVKQAELIRPGPLNILAHGFGLSGLDEEIGEAVLAGRHDMQSAYQTGMLPEVIVRVISCDNLTVVRCEDEQGVTSAGYRRETV